MKATVKETCKTKFKRVSGAPSSKIPVVAHPATGKDSSLNMADIGGSGSPLYIRITRLL